MSEAIDQVQIYTDGGCDPNPGPGGWGAVLIFGVHIKELSGADPASTNNRMELTAALSALKALQRPCEVQLFTDSQYLRRGITEWLPLWLANGWRKANGRAVENTDLWQLLHRESQRHKLTWSWIKGHRGDPLNERADRLARQARRALTGERGDDEEGEEGEEPSPAQELAALPAVQVYARACALGAPGPGGYAALLVLPTGKARLVKGAWPLATSNVMELWAAIAGLQALKERSHVTLYTTSKYVFDGATKWLAAWERGGWRTKGGEDVKNKEVWLELSHVLGDHDVAWQAIPASDRNPHSLRAAEAARAEAEAVKAKK